MKYLQISTVVSYTSVGRIMRQNYDEKKVQGWDCLIAYGRGSDVEGYNTIKIGTNLDCRMHGISTRLFDRHGYGSKKATKKFIAKMDEYKPDVIHLHNIHGYYINFEILFGWLKAHPERKVIWTLHDCWAMTGHCAHFTAVKCDLWKTKCIHCPQRSRYPSSLLLSNASRNFERKKKAFAGVAGMTLVVPSHWLEGIVKESFLKEYKIEVIHNKIYTNIFKPMPSDFREKYGLGDKKIILGVANVWDERKGLNDFIKLSQMLDEQYVVVLVGLSRKQIRKMPKEVIGIERTANIKELVEIYSAADVFVNPSVEETFGMTTIEAQACGTKAIVYSGTACEEIVQQAVGNALWAEGIAIHPGVDSLYNCIINILGSKSES